MKRASVGSSFDDFLAEEGMLPAVEARTIKRVVAWELREALKRPGMTKAILARRMQTSRAALDRLLDPGNVSLTLGVLTRVAHVLGKRVHIDFVDLPRGRRRSAERDEFRTRLAKRERVALGRPAARSLAEVRAKRDRKLGG